MSRRIQIRVLYLATACFWCILLHFCCSCHDVIHIVIRGTQLPPQACLTASAGSAQSLHRCLCVHPTAMAAASPGAPEVSPPPPCAPAMEVWSSVHSWRLERCARQSKSVLRCGVLTPPARSFSTLWTRGKKHFSEVFFVGGCPWRLSLYPKCASRRAREPSRSHPRAPRSPTAAAAARGRAARSPCCAQGKHGCEGQPRACCSVPGGCGRGVRAGRLEAVRGLPPGRGDAAGACGWLCAAAACGWCVRPVIRA